MARTAEEMQKLERSLAYLGAYDQLDKFAAEVEDGLDAFDITPTGDEDVDATVKEAVEYLDSRGLIFRGAENPNIIIVQDEDEPFEVETTVGA